MFEYFYNEIFRRTIIGFGTLFNNISIKKTDDNGNVVSETKVPLAYGPTQKFLARLEQSPNLNKPVQITLPRMSFEFVGLNYDTSRKLTQTQTFLTSLATDNTQPRKAYLPVPYNMDFELSIMTTLNDDMLQIIEQILPYFQPSYNLTITLAGDIAEKRDIPIIFNNITMQDDYEGNFETRRALIYTLRFTAKTYLFGPIASAGISNEIVKKVSIGFVEGGRTTSPRRDLTYAVEPQATKNYTGNATTLLTDNVELETKTFSVADATSLIKDSIITVDDETMKVVSKTGNSITVERGLYETKITEHVSGANLYTITEEDNSLIEFGDDFGFNGLFS
jgi:hypothetical protein